VPIPPGQFGGGLGDEKPVWSGAPVSTDERRSEFAGTAWEILRDPQCGEALVYFTTLFANLCLILQSLAVSEVNICQIFTY